MSSSSLDALSGGNCERFRYHLLIKDHHNMIINSISILNLSLMEKFWSNTIWPWVQRNVSMIILVYILREGFHCAQVGGAHCTVTYDLLDQHNAK